MGSFVQTLIISTLALGLFAIFVSAKGKKSKTKYLDMLTKMKLKPGYLHKKHTQFKHTHTHTPTLTQCSNMHTHTPLFKPANV